MGIDKEQNLLTAAALLRRHAEKQLSEHMSVLGTPRTEEMQRSVHELEVHKIELEMQNAALRQSRDEVESALEKYTDLYDFAPVGYFSLDRSGVITAVNLCGARLLGIDRSRLLGRSFGLHVADEARPFFTAFFEKVFARLDEDSCELELATESNVPLFVQIEALACPSGVECHVAAIDITGRRHAEDELSKKRQELEALNRSIRMLNISLVQKTAELEMANMELESFDYSVAHDLRSPAVTISDLSQRLLDTHSGALDDESKAHLQKINRESKRMNCLVAALLKFSTNLRKHVDKKWTDLSDIANEIRDNLLAQETGRHVTFCIAEGISGYCDPDLLRIVLENLLGNAWKYSARKADARIEFGTINREDNLVYFVRDNGAGFDPQESGNMFTPFQRILCNDTVEGSGIGLATVSRIILRHGGRIWAEGERGKGATFYFTL